MIKMRLALYYFIFSFLSSIIMYLCRYWRRKMRKVRQSDTMFVHAHVVKCYIFRW